MVQLHTEFHYTTIDCDDYLSNENLRLKDLPCKSNISAR